MLISRILGGVGRTMISAGILILLFVSYQLWGTGIRTTAAQGTLRESFAARQAEAVGRTPRTTAPTTSADVTATTPVPTDTTVVGGPAPTLPPEPATNAFPPPKPGDGLGTIAIPKIGVDFMMLEGVDLANLANGPGHFPGTPFPGQPGNAALAGHRTTWQAPFNRIDELVPGDLINITTLQGDFSYEVIAQPAPGGQSLGHKIITPEQLEILDQPADGQNLLTLMACHPKYSAAQRIVVVAKLAGKPAPVTAKSAESQKAVQAPDQAALVGGAEGNGPSLLEGNADAREPAIFWSGIALAAALGAWLIARRWRSWRQWQRWAVLAAASPVFLLPLFYAFENINHLLPAGY